MVWIIAVLVVVVNVYFIITIVVRNDCKHIYMCMCIYMLCVCGESLTYPVLSKWNVNSKQGKIDNHLHVPQYIHVYMYMFVKPQVHTNRRRIALQIPLPTNYNII